MLDNPLRVNLITKTLRDSIENKDLSMMKSFTTTHNFALLDNKVTPIEIRPMYSSKKRAISTQ